MSVLVTENKVLPLMRVPENLQNYGAEYAMQRVTEARKALPEMAVPNRKSEYWKYTPPAKVLKRDYVQPAEYTGSAETPRFDCYEVIIENGTITSMPSHIPEGVHILPLAGALTGHPTVFEPWFGKLLDHREEIFASINMAHLHQGVAVHIEKKTVVDKPIHLVHKFSGEGVMHQPRDIVVSEALSEAGVITSYFSDGLKNSLLNAATECAVLDGAKLTVNKLESVEEGNFQVIQEEVSQARDSYFTINTATLDGDWVRNNLNIRVNGENCQSNLHGLYLQKEKQHIDNHTVVDHKAPHCQSNELYKGVLDDASTGVFNGKVFVRPYAQKTNAFQSNANIVLSDKATINSKPELEIYADDVQCSHGSTTGQLDEEAMFYLRARGLSKYQARRLLIRAFVAEVVDHIDNVQVQDFINDRIEAHFENNG